MSGQIKKNVTPEFSRIFLVERAFLLPVWEKTEASPLEREALSKCLDLTSLQSFSVQWKISPFGERKIKVSGIAEASYERVCVLSLEVFSVSDTFEMTRFFWKYRDKLETDFIDDEESCEDTIKGQIDLGEIATEELSLSLDPYPKKKAEKQQMDFSSEAMQGENPFSRLKDFVFTKERQDAGKKGGSKT